MGGEPYTWRRVSTVRRQAVGNLPPKGGTAPTAEPTVTVEQVKEYLSNHDNVIIYDYTPFCKSSFCLPPNILEDICKKNNTDLLVISNIYDDIFLGVTNNFPILMIKTSVYNTKSRAKYIDKFYHSLIGLNLKEIDYASYHYFSNGNYIKSFKNPQDISL